MEPRKDGEGKAWGGKEESRVVLSGGKERAEFQGRDTPGSSFTASRGKKEKRNVSGRRKRTGSERVGA